MERLAGKVILLWGWRRAVVALLAGAVLALAQPPYDFFAAGFVSFTVLVWLLDGAASMPGTRPMRRLLQPFAIGWTFGFGYFLAGLWWTGKALLVEADLFAWALPLAVLGLPALLACFYGLATALARMMWSDGAGRIAALAFGFGLAEWLRTFVLTGFPWNAVGQAAMPVPMLMQSLPLVGMTAINTLAVFVFAAPALMAAPAGRRAGLAVAAALAILHAGYGAARLALAGAENDNRVAIRIVQPSIDQTEKWDAQRRDAIFATYLDLSARPAERRPELIVWPETAVPYILSERPDALVALSEMLADDQVLFAGAVRVEDTGTAAPSRYYNAVVAIDGDGVVYDAGDKLRLVPFGEYLPFAGLAERIGLRRLVQSVSAFSPGSSRRPLTVRPGVEAMPFICYEVIFPGIAGHGESPADFLLNVTNDAWFGRTPGPYQHFRQAQLRAVEAGRPLVRAANNGISGAVDAYGRVIDAFALDATGALDVDLPLTRAAIPGRPVLAGWLVLALAGLWALAGALPGRRRRD